MLISEEYKQQQKQMHKEMPHYGTSSHQHAGIISHMINTLNVTEVLDYGCGKGTLGKAIRPNHGVKLYQYDPGIDGLDDEPEPTEMVVCTDVLEHIEPESLDAVLDDLKRVTKRVGFFAIHTGPAMKVLPDGRNAHLIQKSYKWWLPKIWRRFRLLNFQLNKHGFTVTVDGTG